ncbi:hypothetical protein KG135_003399 [Salmonella enterica subsp. enterica serovar Poona]|nr:hypothetical protein [Salmonella enterica]EBR0129409.1 hypothetical protein [Salmonella enterica subsp. enterica serovar Ajiobo]EBV2696149.1 hypothetical protein [Salmonella enterica subsp. enterica serovar Poona]EBW5539435.1 hypothetical protein [Salmonella enterica subsp. enterica serovar Pasing]OZU24665.1 hypothetical protein CCO51_19370 [Salmonella enterica subsp. enterica serovar Plymouth]
MTGLVRNGEITFYVHNVLAWQDNSSAERGWSIVSGEVTPYMELQVTRQLWQVAGYDWKSVYSGRVTRSDAFTVMPDELQPENETQNMNTGAWITALEDIQVRFPGAEGAVKRWQANLTPVVMYF